jgi:hydroxymethylbilane synthase
MPSSPRLLPRLVLGTRGSDLALAQERLVRGALEGTGLVDEIVKEVIATTGDKRLDLRLGVPGADKAVFIKELEEALLEGTIDAAVHSLKDVPGELDPAFALVATLPRAPIEDVLVTRDPAHAAKGLASLPDGAVVATSSVRRCRLIQQFRPGLRVVEIRGNVPTRLGKVATSGEFDATILARAGLERLGFDLSGARLTAPGGGIAGCSILDPREFLPAAGQGAIVVEIRAADTGIADIFRRINDVPTWNRIQAERAWLRVLGAGCQTPVGVFSETCDDGRRLRVSTVVFDENGGQTRKAVAEGDASAPEEIARELKRQMDQ